LKNHCPIYRKHAYFGDVHLPIADYEVRKDARDKIVADEREKKGSGPSVADM